MKILYVICLSLLVASCGAADEEKRNLAPYARLADALVTGHVVNAKWLGQDKFVYVRKPRGSVDAAMVKADMARFIDKAKNCKVTMVREVGEPTEAGYSVPGGDIVITCDELIKGCGAAVFAIFSDTALGESPIKIESQNAGNRCDPEVELFAARSS